MRKFIALLEALRFIEDNLTEPVTQEAIARSCFCSVSALQKVFRYALHTGVMDYVDRRRVTMAAKALLSSGERVLDVALRFQYRSPEVFARAFRRRWGVTPTAFRREWRFSGLFPRVTDMEEGRNDMPRRKVDISELYEALRDMRGCYVLCFDIVGMTEINGIGDKAGDLAIVECLRRIDREADDNMLLLRIGGDEFALMTGLSEASGAEALARRVLMKNGGGIECNGQKIPVSMRVGGMRVSGTCLKYDELFAALHETIQEARDAGEMTMR